MNYIKLPIKTLYRGKVGINEKYVKQAVLENKGIAMKYRDEITVIPPDEVESKIAYRSGIFKDKFGGGNYSLVYYTWRMPEKQLKLI